MPLQDDYVLAKFGIDEIYICKELTPDLLHKLHQRALFSLDAEDHVVKKHLSCDMVLIFYKQEPNPSLIRGFLKFLDQFPEKDNFIESNRLINEEELFPAIKTKTFVLLTYKSLSKD